MSLAGYHHGVRVTEINEGTNVLRIISTAVIGIVGTAPDATADLPLNKPTLFTSIRKAQTAAGKTGTLAGALSAIAGQVRPTIIVVRVAEGVGDTEDERIADQTSKTVGSVVDGQYTGVQALRAAQAQLGVRPRILGAPGLDTQPVANALATLGAEMRAFAYVYANECETVSDAIAYRNQFGSRELMVLWPQFKHWDTTANASVPTSPVAYAMGLRAKIDKEVGWHKTLSNMPLNGPIGISKDIYWDLQNPDTDAGLLNSEEVTTLINHQGYRFWGSRTCAADDFFAFESATRTAHILADTIAEGHFSFVDKPLHPTLVKDIIESVNARFRSLKAMGYIIDGEAWYDAEVNTNENLKSGKLIIDYDYTPVPPLEDLGFQQRITDRYFSDFAARVAAGQ